MIVDSHVHVVSDDPRRYPLRPAVATNPWYETHPCSGPQLRALMRGAGVDAAVLVQGVGAYEYDNAYVLDAAADAPGVFTPVVCSDRRADAAVVELRRLVAQGARGYRWFCVYDDPRVEQPAALWDALATLAIPVVVTFLPDGLDPFARVARGFPDLRFAVDHCAFVDLSQGVPDVLDALAALTNVWWKVSTHALHTASAGGADPAEVVAELAHRVGGRLMWGSDFPQTHHAPYPEIVEEGRRAAGKLSPADREAYLAGSAVCLWPELAPPAS